MTETQSPVEGKRLATWGTDLPDDLVLDENLLAEALKKVNMDLWVLFLSDCVLECGIFIYLSFLVPFGRRTVSWVFLISLLILLVTNYDMG